MVIQGTLPFIPSVMRLIPSLPPSPHSLPGLNASLGTMQDPPPLQCVGLLGDGIGPALHQGREGHLMPLLTPPALLTVPGGEVTQGAAHQGC